MRKLSLMFIAVLILVVMVFAMTQGSALGLGNAGGKAAVCPAEIIEGKGKGVVAKVPCFVEP